MWLKEPTHSIDHAVLGTPPVPPKGEGGGGPVGGASMYVPFICVIRFGGIMNNMHPGTRWVCAYFYVWAAGSLDRCTNTYTHNT